MPPVRKLLLSLSVLSFPMLAVVPAAQAQAWPAKPIRMVVPYPPGGPTDIVARVVGQKLSERLGQPVVVDNRPGAGGNIGADAVAKSAPDGYTMLVATTAHAINMTLFARPGYHTRTDFAPVSMLTSGPLVLVTAPSTPVHNVAELIAMARANPGKVTFASSGNGQSTHLSAELFDSMAGIRMTHVPYKGSSQAVQALLGNQVDLVFENSVAAMPMIQSGKFRALATTGARRAAELPDVPTMAESGLNGYEIVSWQAIFAPAGTPRPIVDKLSTEIGKIIRQPEVRAKLASMGVEPSGAGPTELGNFQKSEVAKWANLIKVANIHLE